MKIAEIIQRCQKVAKLNDDEFGYKIDIDVESNVFRFECYETADDHEFVSGSSENCDCFDITEDDISDAASAWGYKTK